MNGGRRRCPTSVCCIPSTDSDNTTTSRSNNRCKFACRYLQDANKKCCDGAVLDDSTQHKMVIKSGPHGLHAISSQDIKAGCIILQCLPLAHSTLVLPGGMMMEDNADDDEEDDGSGRKKICSRCFIKEGGINIESSSENSRRKKFGRCSKCRMVYYCSRSCQSQDWIEQHKLECQYYVKRGKLHQSTPYAANSNEDAIPLLLRTFNSLKYLREKNSVEEEEEGVIHQHQKRDGIVSCGPDHFSSLAVSSESHSFAKNDGSAMILAKDLIESYAVRGLSSTTDVTCKIKAALDIWGYKEGISEKQPEVKTHDTAILRTLNAFQKNNFGIVNSLHTAIGEGVYPCAALLNHSCDPNCILRYNLHSSSTMQHYSPPILQIVACRDILLGEELCHSYVDLALTTHERQSRLLDTHGFKCECKRCTKNGCLIQLPENRNEWELWPLLNGLQIYGGEHNVDEKVPMRKVDLDDAMTVSRGLSQSELAKIIHQSQALQHKASQAMVAGDAEGELHYFKKAIELYRPCQGSKVWFSPFHSQLYTLRCSYLSALLANGNIHEAVHVCEHLVSFLVVAFSHVQNHPLLGLQLYTLGDLYSAAATMEEEGTERRSNTKKAKLAYTWAKSLMKVSHGETDHMVQVLNDSLASMN